MRSAISSTARRTLSGRIARMALAALSMYCGLRSLQAADLGADSLLAPAATSSDFRSFGLSSATRETLVDGITAAENVMFSSDGRLFVTGDDGIYELTRAVSGEVVKLNLFPGAGCAWSGMAEVGTVLYATCFNGTDSFLFAARRSASPNFRTIFTLRGVTTANGLAADAAGRLYVTTTLQGDVLRIELQPGDRFSVASQVTLFSKTAGLIPNGLKVFRQRLFIGDVLGTLRAAAIEAPRIAVPLVQQFALFDDLFVDSRGLLVADFSGGAIRAFDAAGRMLDWTRPGALQNPSAVVPANGRLGLGPRDLIVTEKGGHRVSVLRSTH